MKWTVQVNDQWQPIGQGKVLHTDSQFGRREEVNIWTEEECDEDGKMKFPADRAVLVIGTGHAVPDLTEFIGTVIPVGAGGHLVWHVYGGV